MVEQSALPALLEREHELDAVASALAGVDQGTGRFLAFDGEPGIGKSALLREVSARAGARHVRVLSARATQSSRTCRSAWRCSCSRRCSRTHPRPSASGCSPGPRVWPSHCYPAARPRAPDRCRACAGSRPGSLARAVRQGRLDEAVAEAHDALDLAHDGWSFVASRTAGLLVRGHVARGDLPAARRAAQAVTDAQARETMFFGLFGQAALGELLLAEGRSGEALAPLVAAGEGLAGRNISNAAILPWRPQAVMAAMALGDHGRAAALAADELEEARRIGLPGRIGAALRAQALATVDVEQRAEAGRRTRANRCCAPANSHGRMERLRSPPAPRRLSRQLAAAREGALTVTSSPPRNVRSRSSPPRA
jgi:hypothetical protein